MAPCCLEVYCSFFQNAKNFSELRSIHPAEKKEAAFQSSK